VRDGQGLEVANADADALAALDALREDWLADRRCDRFPAIADRHHDCPMLSLMAANLALSSHSQGGRSLGARYLVRAKAMALQAGARERAWLAATEAWLAGERDRCLALHEKMIAEWPDDLLAGKLGLQHALNLGDAEAQLRLAERLLAAHPGHPPVLGMHAFALGECKRPDEAEDKARHALARAPHEPSACRALSHCLVASGRLVEAEAFLRPLIDGWPEGRQHLARLLIDMDRPDEALVLFDQMRRASGDDAEDTVNAVALLARVELHGVDVGARWQDVARPLDQRLHDHFVPLLDLHYLYGLARAAKAGVTEMLASLEDRAEQARPFEREAWADGAVPMAHGLAAHARGDAAEAAPLLGQAMPHLRTLGGSSDQRALFGAIHLDALIKSGWNDAALKILQVDAQERPGVPAIQRALADLYRKLGRAEQALAADYQAEQLVRQYASA